LTARIRACEARPGLAKCGGAKTHKGHSPTGFLRNPNRPNRAVSSYRLLSAVLPYFIIIYFINIILEYLFNNLITLCNKHKKNALKIAIYMHF